jgi:hypothetical protein
MRFLGMRNSEFSKMKWRYDPISYFTENDN